MRHGNNSYSSALEDSTTLTDDSCTRRNTCAVEVDALAIAE